MRCSLNPKIIKIINKIDKKEFGLKYGVLRLDQLVIVNSYF